MLWLNPAAHCTPLSGRGVLPIQYCWLPLVSDLGVNEGTRAFVGSGAGEFLCAAFSASRRQRVTFLHVKLSRTFSLVVLQAFNLQGAWT